MNHPQHLENRRIPKRFYFLTALIYLPIISALVLIHALWYGYLLAVFSFVMLLWMRHTALWQRFRIPLCFAVAFMVAFFGLYWSRPQHDVSLMGQIGRESIRFFMRLPIDDPLARSGELMTVSTWKAPEGYQMETAQLSHSKLEILTKIGLPRALPYLFASLKIAITLAFVGSVIAETVAANSGLGHMMLAAQSQFNVPLVWAGLIMLAIEGIIMYAMMAWLETRMTGWAHRSQMAAV